ncbi:MAG: ribose-phosphate diphosphokinase, partial [Planctomycetaceae bacterium]|nr:ribose-phosphate diphosphokinase [Planctomycetaceae bacterium]
PDVGFAKGASGYANILGVPVVIGNKTRYAHDEQATILEVIGEVEGKNVLIVDDFTISGGTLISMAAVLKQRGAKNIYAAVSHAVLSNGASERIAASQIKRMFITDTIESHLEQLPPNIEVVSVANLFAEAIQSIHDRTSISQLFPEAP